MHENNIILLRDEALRLIELEIKTLAAMCEAPGLLTQEKQEQVQTLDQQSAKNHMNILDGERIKLEKLDMVLAVVGTMKAGKSTTINAIVGTEVLPNRNAPMTAIPTLIRHTLGQIDPKLSLSHLEPIEALRAGLRKKLSDHKYEKVLSDIKQSGGDLHELVREISTGTKLSAQHTGPDAIFCFLKGLNDLVRLAPLLEIEFPFDEYANVDKLPVISVEFAHLNDVAPAAGTLTLLDTPGPNEEGQSRLRPMLKEQLSKASAVLAVLDYTQLKSKADAQVREDLAEIASVAKGRLYALVNKFDQKDRNGMDKIEVCNFVYGLMQGEKDSLISKDHIFPVSSRFAYLANRARNAIDKMGTLPDSDQQPWVSDFGEEALGRRWKSQVQDAAEVQKAAQQLWDDSYFQKPLTGVIHVAHTHAAILAVDSSAAKLMSVANAMQNICTTRETALQKSTSELQTLVKALQTDIQKIEECKQSVARQQEDNLKIFKNNLRKRLKELASEANKNLDQYFKEGKRKEQKIVGEMNSHTKSEFPFRGGASLFSTQKKIKPDLQEQHFDPSSPEINFRQDKLAAETLIQKIRETMDGVISSANHEIASSIEVLLKSFEKEFQSGAIDAANKVLTELKRRMDKEGFGALSIELPKRESMQLKLSGARMLSDAIEERERTETRMRQQDSIFGGAKRLLGGWFSKDWGYDDYSVKVTDYKVNIESIKKQVNASVSATFDGLETALATQVQKPLQQTVDKFFKAFRLTMEEVRGDLLQSLDDKAKDKKTQESMLDDLRQLKKSIPAQLTDAQALNLDVKNRLPSTTD